MKILIIDNYDSFTFNLYQYVGEILSRDENPFMIDVVRNDALTVQEVSQRNYDKIIISPGSGDPTDSAYFGVCAEVIATIGKTTPVLGVCLGMQGIAAVFGGKVVLAKTPMHGKTSNITHDEKGLFTDLPQDLEVMRYHSLIVSEEGLPASLAVTAIANGNKEIMGLRHHDYPIEGIQFHPESFATEAGKQMLANFVLR